MNATKLYISLIMLVTLTTTYGCATTQPSRIRVPDVPPPVTKPIKPVTVALVLSSGGFRGGAHVGVIEVLEENKIPVDLIVGSSAGSFVGAFYADEPNVGILKSKLLDTNYKQLVDTSWFSAIKAPFFPTGPIQGKALQNFMLRNMRSQDFSELKIPLVVVTTSIVSNQLEILQTGPIIPAVHASSALPPYFAPVRMYQNVFVDGAVIAPVPVAVARLYNPKLVIAVDISRQPSLSKLSNAFQVTSRSMDISFNELARRQASGADIIIRPEIIGYGPFEDGYNLEFYEAGRRAALAQIEDIKKAFLKIKS